MNGNGKPAASRLTVREGRDQRPSLEDAQVMVGGYVALVNLPNGDQLLINEEGMLHKLAVNEAVRDLLGILILGNVLILKGDARWD